MKQTLDIAIFATALIAVALLADAWHSARHDSQQLAATLAAQNTSIQQSADREKQRDSQLATALASIQKQKRAVQSPEQAATELPSVLPQLPLPITIQSVNLSAPLPPGETPSSAQNSNTTPTETPTTTLSIPQPDLVPLYDALQDCRASTAETTALQKDLSDEKSRSASLQHERDAAIASARGGSFLTRLKRAAKWFAIGAAVGALAAGAVAPTAIHH